MASFCETIISGTNPNTPQRLAHRELGVAAIPGRHNVSSVKRLVQACFLEGPGEAGVVQS